MTTLRRHGLAAGFTLIELVVVLAILGLLLALLPDALSIAIPGQQLRAAAYQLADDLKDARTRAVVSGEPTSIRIALSEYDGQLAVGMRKLPHGATIQVADVPRQTLAGGLEQMSFFPDGSASGGRISLAVGTRKYVISIDWLTGRVTVDG